MLLPLVHFIVWVLSSAGIELIFHSSCWADPSSQSNGIFCTMWCHAQYLSRSLLKNRLFATQEQAEYWAVRTLHVVYAFYQYYWLLFSSPFAVLLNCSHPNPWVFAFFLLILLPIPPGRGKERESHSVVLCRKLRQNQTNCFWNNLTLILRTLNYKMV